MRSLRMVEDVLGTVRESINYELKVHTLQVFLAIGNEVKPINSTELIQRTGLDQRTVSRDTTQLGTRMVKQDDGSYKPSGLGLIEAKPDPYETRQLCYFLTLSGEKLMNKLNKIFK